VRWGEEESYHQGTASMSTAAALDGNDGIENGFSTRHT